MTTGPEPPSLPTPAAAILVSGPNHSCSLNPDGVAYCWGLWRRVPGEPSLPTPPTRVQPEGSELRFTTLSAGFHTCGLTQEGVAYCWGPSNQWGELGDGSTEPNPQPVQVSTDLRFIQITAASQSTCALTAAGQVYCWGHNRFGGFGNGEKQEGVAQPLPVRVPTGLRFRSLTGADIICGLDLSGRPYCWGEIDAIRTLDTWVHPGSCTEHYYREFEGQGCLTPTPVKGKLRFERIARGSTDCGVTASGQGYCWGDGVLGSLGNSEAGPLVHSVEPALVAGGHAFAAISTGSHVCGLTLDGQAFCWGTNFRGQLGNGQDGTEQLTIPFAAVPTPVVGDQRFVAIAAGFFHTCAMTESREIWCWGINDRGQLGRPPALGDSNVPVRVEFP